MRFDVHDSISDFEASEWNQLAGSRFPFNRHEFLRAAELGGCVSPATGWTARHIGGYDRAGRLVAAMPLYEKTHSWGEFVFDWSWAQAYQRAGLEYYPKLVSATPFTPAPGTRLLTSSADTGLAEGLLETALQFAGDNDYSSLHVLFPLDDELPLLEAAGLKLRKDCQFHWHNRGYRSFDDFLATFSSAKRKKARRDRRHVAEHGVRFRWLDGHDLDGETWAKIFRLISITFMRRGGLPYFDFDFFTEVSGLLPANIIAVVAEQDDDIIATAVFFRSPDTLYGRYWGTSENINALHFETCYYQGIEYCIRHGIQRFEPGTQGEHKISRGFSPVSTWSAHWLRRDDFFSAIGDFLTEEQQYMDRYIDAVQSHTPYKKDGTPT